MPVAGHLPSGTPAACRPRGGGGGCRTGGHPGHAGRGGRLGVCPHHPPTRAARPDKRGRRAEQRRPRWTGVPAGTCSAWIATRWTCTGFVGWPPRRAIVLPGEPTSPAAPGVSRLVAGIGPDRPERRLGSPDAEGWAQERLDAVVAWAQAELLIGDPRSDARSACRPSRRVSRGGVRGGDVDAGAVGGGPARRRGCRRRGSGYGRCRRRSARRRWRIRRGFRRVRLCTFLDWDSGNPAFAISRGSPSTPFPTPGHDRWLAGMLLSPSPFGSPIPPR
jgi:hypothetical protein